MNRINDGERKAYELAASALPKYDIDMGINRVIVGYDDGIRRYFTVTHGETQEISDRSSIRPKSRAIICECSICRPVDPPAGGLP